MNRPCSLELLPSPSCSRAGTGGAALLHGELAAEQSLCRQAQPGKAAAPGPCSWQSCRQLPAEQGSPLTPALAPPPGRSRPRPAPPAAPRWAPAPCCGAPGPGCGEEAAGAARPRSRPHGTEHGPSASRRPGAPGAPSCPCAAPHPPRCPFCPPRCGDPLASGPPLPASRGRRARPGRAVPARTRGTGDTRDHGSTPAPAAPAAAAGGVGGRRISCEPRPGSAALRSAGAPPLPGDGRQHRPPRLLPGTSRPPLPALPALPARRPSRPSPEPLAAAQPELPCSPPPAAAAGAGSGLRSPG